MAKNSNIIERIHGTMRMFAARTGARDVVTIEGSLLGGENMLSRAKEMVPSLVASLLDAGTAKRTKEEVRSALAARGASISFSAGGDRMRFHATCVPDDTSFILALIAECICDASFAASELTLQKKRSLAELEEAKTNTLGLAMREFNRMIYDPSHTNYSSTLPELRKDIESSERSDLVGFKKVLGTGGLVLALTGDVEPEVVLSQAQRAFSTLAKGTLEAPHKQVNTATPSHKESRIVVPNKANIDVIIGARIPLTYNDPHYLPFSVVTDLLGARGVSGGHLMRTIRERDGLTYGIYAVPAGFSDGADGALRIWATFSPPTYERAVEQTLKEIEFFRTKGITEKALTSKKSQLRGKYVVGLATSGGLASVLHTIGVEGKPLTYIKEYPDRISALTLKEVREAAHLIPWGEFSIASAGTFLNSKAGN